MKKNIWSNVYYRLKDPVMIRLAVLYSLEYIDIPICLMDLKHVMLDSTSVDYIELCEMIENLKKEDYIRVVERDETNKYIITDKGRELLSMFKRDLLPSVRKNIRKSADEYFHNEFTKSQFKCEISLGNENAYYLDVQINDKKMKMLSMSIFAGSRENAVKMREKFNAAPMELFKEILCYLKEDSKKE